MISKILEILLSVVDQDNKKDGSFIVLIFAFLSIGMYFSFNFLFETIEEGNIKQSLEIQNINLKIDGIKKEVLLLKTYTAILKDRETRKP